MSRVARNPKERVPKIKVLPTNRVVPILRPTQFFLPKSGVILLVLLSNQIPLATNNALPHIKIDRNSKPKQTSKEDFEISYPH
jgi:hypothetical protein